MKKKILVLEPYFGGSHRQFLEGLAKNVEADFYWLTLPARKWKMRMQLSAYWFYGEIEKNREEFKNSDVILCSTFVDVAVLRSLLSRIAWWDNGTRILTYFHENQFAYPNQIADSSIHQFTAINFGSAVASDKIGFNSRFNRDSFLDGCRKYLKKAADMNLVKVVENLEEKSSVLYPGIDFTAIDKKDRKHNNSLPVIIWNHRWEHDKGPESFFAALYNLKERGVQFKLIVLGESFRYQPACFKEAEERLADELIHFGYADSFEEYIVLLTQGDIVVSTSLHEFYGISVIEAVRAGNYPVLPERLSYPELFDDQFLYGEGQLEDVLQRILKSRKLFDGEKVCKMTDQFSWDAMKSKYENWLFG